MSDSATGSNASRSRTSHALGNRFPRLCRARRSRPPSPDTTVLSNMRSDYSRAGDQRSASKLAPGRRDLANWRTGQPPRRFSPQRVRPVPLQARHAVPVEARRNHPQRPIMTLFRSRFVRCFTFVKNLLSGLPTRKEPETKQARLARGYRGFAFFSRQRGARIARLISGSGPKPDIWLPAWGIFGPVQGRCCRLKRSQQKYARRYWRTRYG